MIIILRHKYRGVATLLSIVLSISLLSYLTTWGFTITAYAGSGNNEENEFNTEVSIEMPEEVDKSVDTMDLIYKESDASDSINVQVDIIDEEDSNTEEQEEEDSSTEEEQEEDIELSDIEKYNELLDIEEEDPDYQSEVIELSDEEKELAERIVEAETCGQEFEGAALVAQTIRDAIVYDGYETVSDVRTGRQYASDLSKEPSETSIRAVEYIFDEGGVAVQHKIIYFYAYNKVESSFHESQQFVTEYGGHRFFTNWE